MLEQSKFVIGPLVFYGYGLIVGFAFLTFVLVSRQRAVVFNLAVNDWYWSLLAGSVGALLGARLYHLLDYFDYYQLNPIKVFFVWEGGLGIFGAIIGAVLFLWVWAKVKKVSLTWLLNLFFPPLLLAQAVGRLGNLVNQEGAWWEAIPLFLGFWLYLFLEKRYNVRKYAFCYYLVAAGLIRLATEFFRTDTWQVNGLKVAHLISLAFIVTGLQIFRTLRS